jgi:hypothetical protein
MKTRRVVVLVALAGAHVWVPQMPAVNPDVAAAIVRQFGEAQSRNVVLATSKAESGDPVEWKVYSKDPYRPGEFVCSKAVKLNGQWQVTPDSAGKLLKRVPRLPLDFKRLQVTSLEARQVVTTAARIADVPFATMNFQLAANDVTGAPEWGIALQDANRYEVGFCVVSGETGALISESWTPKYATEPPPSPAAQEGAEAARKVKQGVRKAWNWTEDAGRKTGGFFKELFR